MNDSADTSMVECRTTRTGDHAAEVDDADDSSRQPTDADNPGQVPGFLIAQQEERMVQETSQEQTGQEPEATTNDDTQEPEGQEQSGGTQITDPEVLQKELNEARQEAAKNRTERKEATERVTALESQMQAIMKALGQESDEPDPDALASELESVRSQLHQERLTNQFTRIASQAEADTDLTLAYLSHRGKLSDLDPDTENFEAQLKERIDTALQEKPSLRASAQPSRGGAEFTGENGGRTTTMNDRIRGAVPRRG